MVGRWTVSFKGEHHRLLAPFFPCNARANVKIAKSTGDTEPPCPPFRRLCQNVITLELGWRLHRTASLLTPAECMMELKVNTWYFSYFNVLYLSFVLVLRHRMQVMHSNRQLFHFQNSCCCIQQKEIWPIIRYPGVVDYISIVKRIEKQPYVHCF